MKVDVETAPAVALRSGVPTIASSRDGRPVAASVDATPRRMIEADLGLAPAGN